MEWKFHDSSREALAVLVGSQTRGRDDHQDLRRLCLYCPLLCSPRKGPPVGRAMLPPTMAREVHERVQLDCRASVTRWLRFRVYGLEQRHLGLKQQQHGSYLEIPIPLIN